MHAENFNDIEIIELKLERPRTLKRYLQVIFFNGKPHSCISLRENETLSSSFCYLYNTWRILNPHQEIRSYNRNAHTGTL